MHFGDTCTLTSSLFDAVVYCVHAHKIAHLSDDFLFSELNRRDENEDDDFVSPRLGNDVKDFILRLLIRDRDQRLGSKSIDDILSHPFFDDINATNGGYEFDWNDIRMRDHLPAPILRHLATREPESDTEKKLDRELDHPMYDFNVNDWNDNSQQNSINNNNNSNNNNNNNNNINTPQSTNITPIQTGHESNSTMLSLEEKYDQPLAPIVESGLSDGTMPLSHAAMSTIPSLPAESNAGDQNSSQRANSNGNKSDNNNNNNDATRTSLPNHLNTVITHKDGDNDYMHLSEPMVPPDQKHYVEAVIDAAKRKQESMEIGGAVAAAAVAVAVVENKQRDHAYSDADSTDDLFGNYVPPPGINGRNGNEDNNKINDDFGLGAAPTNEENMIMNLSDGKGGNGNGNEMDQNGGGRDRANSEVSDQIAAAAHLREPIPAKDDNKGKKKKKKMKERKSLFNRKNNNNDNDDAASDDEMGGGDILDNRGNTEDYDNLDDLEAALMDSNNEAANNNNIGINDASSVSASKKPKRSKFLKNRTEKSKLGLDKILKSKADSLFADKFRKAVSKKKRRFIDKNHDFNLDLTCMFCLFVLFFF